MTTSSESLAAAVTGEARHQMAESLARIEHCVAQLSTEQLWWRPTPQQNSVGNLLLHLAGNIRQWIVAGVAGAPDTRNRPAEFAERRPRPAGELLAQLRDVIQQADRVLDGLSADHLFEPRRIQGFDTSVLKAIFHVATHLQGHAQEIISLTRMQLGEAYRFEFVPQSPEQGAPAYSSLRRH